MYLPEMRPADMKRISDVGSPAREERRMEAIKWVEDRIIGLVLHYTGECTALCNHDTGPGPNHPKSTCKAQVKYLATIMKAFVSILPEILTPFGLVHINGPEAKHAAYMPHRPKRVKLTCPECQLGECRGALAAVQLSLGYWDMADAPRLYPEYELAVTVNEQHVSGCRQVCAAAGKGKAAGRPRGQRLRLRRYGGRPRRRCRPRRARRRHGGGSGGGG